MDALEPLGQKLLARTLVPLVTEVSDCGRALDRLPAFVFGGRALGLDSGRFETLAQPLLGADPLEALASGTLGPARAESLLRTAGLPGVSSIVVGTIDPEHLAENVAAVSSVRV